MRKNIFLFIELILVIITFILFVWKFLPPFSPLIEVFLSSQTLKMFAGLFFLLLSLLLIFLRKNILNPAGLSLLFSALLLLEAAGYYSVPRKIVETSAENSFTMMSFNVKYDAPCSDKLIDIVRSHNPDIIALQEFDARHVVALGGRLAQMGYFSVVDTAMPADGAFAYAVYSRFPLKNHVLLHTDGPYWKTQWPLQACEFLFEGEWIMVVNLHVIPPHNPFKGLFPYAPQQKLIPAQLQEIVDFAGNGERPALIAGDFNQTPSSKFLHVLDDNFTGSWSESGSGFGFTWLNPRPVFKIDFLYHSPHFQSISSQVIENDFSDHRGLLVKFTLK